MLFDDTTYLAKMFAGIVAAVSHIFRGFPIGVRFVCRP